MRLEDWGLLACWFLWMALVALGVEKLACWIRGGEVKYRAVLIEPGVRQERPVTIVGNHLAEMQWWGRLQVTASGCAEAKVEIYEMRETPVWLIQKGGEDGAA